MFNSLLIDTEQESLTSLKTMLDFHFPHISICGQAQSLAKASRLIGDINPELVFFNIELLDGSGVDIVEKFSSAEYEVIMVTSCQDHAMDAIRCCAAGYVMKPIKEDDLIQAVNNASKRIAKKTEYSRNKLLVEKLLKDSVDECIVGIPTIEGYEFIPIKDILRLEGLQKCTRIITRDKTDIVSSYNLGEFRKLLEEHNFFSPHKSHLINLSHIRKYHREGSIMMVDGSFVPVAKRRKKDFLDQIKHV